MHPSIQRLLAAGSAAVVVAVGLAPAPTAHAAGTAELTKAANYLVRNLPDSDDGVGAAIHTATALATTNNCTYAPTLRSLVARIEKGATSYLYPGKKLNQARAANLAITVEALGLDSRRFAGYNLPGLVKKGLPSSGAVGASGSTFNQSLGIIALTRAEASIPVTMLTSLLKLQTDDGSFGYEFPAGTVNSDPDSTGIGILALEAIGELDPQVDDALQWAENAQLSDGSWPNDFSPVDTTGILGSAVAAVGGTAEAERGLAWLGTQQLADGGFPASRDGDSSDRSATSNALWLISGKNLLSVQLNLGACPKSPPKLPASTTSCTGVWVVVDRGNGQSSTRCATRYGSGLEALRSAGFTTTTTQTQFGPFLCRIHSFPSTCSSTSNTFWGYWTATANTDGTWSDWTESPVGASTSEPVKGTVEGWIYGPWLNGAQPDLSTPPLGYEASPVPAITGTAKSGRTLTAVPGTWTPEPAFSYRWYRSGTAIAGATKATYKLTSADVGKTLTVKVTGRLDGYQSVSRTSLPTARVTK